MRCIHFTTLAVASLATCAVIATEPEHPSKVTGTWKLIQVNDDGSDVGRSSSGTIGPIPKGVGHVHLSDGEFFVPGEMRGSKRFTLPNGLHFRVEPIRLDENSVIADVLLGYTTIRAKSDVGFVAQKEMSDGRYSIPLGKPYSVTLSVRNAKTKFKLELELQTK